MEEQQEDPVVNTIAVIVPAPTGKKRGRKPKNAAVTTIMGSGSNIQVDVEETPDKEEKQENDDLIGGDDAANVVLSSDDKPPAKKRGRKPKGGKIIQQLLPVVAAKEQRPNVILHLKCSMRDLHGSNNLLTGNDIQGFNYDATNHAPINNPFSYEELLKQQDTQLQPHHFQNDFEESDEDSEPQQNQPRESHDIRDIWKKLKLLEHNLHLNNICDKKSACFWCTYEFDNPPIYIPKYFIKESYHVYGCFCSPECATAYLMEENIDSSAKFERYHLINHVYSKIFNYTKNIKPAPNPYYMLEKFYGNLTIQEYRALLRNERLFLIVDKPLTRVLPELHEDNDDFIINNKIIPSNNYQVKKKLQQKKQTKKNILSERFGLLSPSANTQMSSSSSYGQVGSSSSL